MVLGNRCRMFCTKWKPDGGGTYLKGHKWCKNCADRKNGKTGWIVIDGFKCPCCRGTMRCKPRGNTKCRMAVVMVKTDGRGYVEY